MEMNRTGKNKIRPDFKQISRSETRALSKDNTGAQSSGLKPKM